MIVYTLALKEEVNKIFDGKQKDFLSKCFYYFLDNALYMLEKGQEKENGECMILAFEVPTSVLKESMEFQLLEFDYGNFSKEILGSKKIEVPKILFPTFKINEKYENEVKLIGMGSNEQICAKRKEEQEKLFIAYYLKRSSYSHYLKDMADYTKCCNESEILNYLENNKDLFFKDDIVQLKKS